MSTTTDKPALTFEDAVRAIDGGPPNAQGWVNGQCPVCAGVRVLGLLRKPDGAFAIKCHKDCSRKQVIAALESKTGKEYSNGKKKKKPDLTGLTMMEYAQMKRLPPLFLGMVFHTGQRNHSDKPAVSFPWCEADGTCTGVKLRLGKSSHDTIWDRYVRAGLYGLDVLAAQQQLGWNLSCVAIVEGESDAQTLVFNGIPALGVAGTKGWNPAFASIPILKNAKKVLVVQEPGAEGFVDEVLDSFSGRGYRVVLPAKDPSQLWLENTPEDFLAAWTKASTTDAEDRNTPFTDTGNAERLVKIHGPNFRWLTDEDTFRIWDGTVWRQSGNGELLLPQTKEVVRAIADDKWREQSESAGKRKAMIAMAKGETAVHATADSFDTHRMLLNVQNCTIDLDTGLEREFTREDLLTKQARVPHEYFAQCPRFDDFLDFTFDGDQETIHFILKALGYTLTGQVGESCFFICYGLGANGKTTLLETMLQILGPDYARPAKFSTFVHSKLHDPKYELATFKGMRMITAAEPRKAGHLDEEVLKQITGGDQIMARDIYKENVAYYPEFKLWLAMNNKPRIIGTDEGIWRRVRLIPFNVRVPDSRKVKELHKVLFAEEGPGVLNRLLEGVEAWKAEGLEPSGAVKQATEEFRAEQNVIQGFFDTCTEVAPWDSGIKAGALYECYCAWAEKQNEFAMRGNEFAEELKRRNFKSKRHNDGVHWYGIALKALQPV
jgi:putative DNA primase/helicase